ncbi:MAG: hypothetical protein Q9159_007093 [Coniocarpon cinnabarinum]
MKKFSLKKDKSEDGLEETKRSALFGGRSKSKSPAPPSQNPYAVPSNNPNPYANAPSLGYGAPPSYNSSSPYNSPGIADPRTRNEKSPVPPGGYGGQPQRGFAPPSGGYGGQSGYGGNNPYSNAAAPPPSGNGRSGGYGGLGDEPNKDALFGGAKDRFDQQKKQQDQQFQNQGLPPEEQGQLSGAGGYGNDYGDQGYGRPYQDRQLTAEEEEEEDVTSTKDQIRDLKRQDVSSTRNALRLAQQAEETGRATLERLGNQGERIHNTERNLDLASSQNRLAEEKARELKHLNRSMWAMKVDNPFTKKSRERARDEEIMRISHNERERRDATRAAAWATQNRASETQRDLRGSAAGAERKRGNLAERSKYQFEADSEDEAMEDELDQNLDDLGRAVGGLNKLGKAMGKEVDVQIGHIDRITGKTDQVDDQIAMNRARIDRIH